MFFGCIASSLDASSSGDSVTIQLRVLAGGSGLLICVMREHVGHLHSGFWRKLIVSEQVDLLAASPRLFTGISFRKSRRTLLTPGFCHPTKSHRLRKLPIFVYRTFLTTARRNSLHSFLNTSPTNSNRPAVVSTARINMAKTTTLKEFESVFPKLVDDLLEHAKKYNLPEQFVTWYKAVSLNPNEQRRRTF